MDLMSTVEVDKELDTVAIGSVAVTLESST